MPAVQGMDPDEAARQAVENACAQIVKIEQARKIEKQTAIATLCSFKYDEAMQVLTRKSEEFGKISDEYREFVSRKDHTQWDTSIDPDIVQQFRDTHPGYVDIINKVIKPSGWDPKKNDPIRGLLFANTILKNEGVSRRTTDDVLTEDQLIDIKAKANDFYIWVIQMRGILFDEIGVLAGV